MNKSKIVSAVMVMALTVTALAAVPIQSTAQANSYDDSFDAIARRHGYYRVFVEATTTGAATTTQNGSDLARGAAADTARWVAMGEFYTRLLETKQERAAQADVARWIAQGEFYASLDSQDGSDPASGAAADTARWVAMGELYASLISQSKVNCQGEGCGR